VRGAHLKIQRFKLCLPAVGKLIQRFKNSTPVRRASKRNSKIQTLPSFGRQLFKNLPAACLAVRQAAGRSLNQEFLNLLNPQTNYTTFFNL